MAKTDRHIEATDRDIVKMEEGDKKVDAQRVQKKIVRGQASLKETVNIIARQHELHKTLYRTQYARSMIDVAKNQSINVGKSSEPLRTNGWKRGDMIKLREGPKNAKKGRKRRKTQKVK